MAVGRPVLAVDRLVAAYNVLLAGVWGTLFARAVYAPWIFVAHAAAVALPYLLARAPRRPSRLVGVLGEIYPLLWLLGFWTELGFVRELLHVGAHEDSIRGLDLAVFGAHWNGEWMPRMPQLWLSETMHFVYFAYYALIFLPPIVVGLAGRTEALRDMALRLLVTYVGCYVVYLAYPVDGPNHTMTHYAGALTDGFFYRLVHGAVHMGDSLGTAFPSSHVAGAVTIAYLAHRWFSSRVATLFTAEAIGVFFSTVYTQMHYPIDAVAGVVWGLGLQIVVVPLLTRRFEPQRQPVPVPILPAFTPMPVPRPATGGGL